MAEVKYQFDGIAKFNATLIFTALAGSSWGSFLTSGFVGRLVFFFLEKFGNWMANQGLAMANIGVDILITAHEKKNYDAVLEEAIHQVQSKRNLTQEEIDAIDEKVKAAAKKFIAFV